MTYKKVFSLLIITTVLTFLYRISLTDLIGLWPSSPTTSKVIIGDVLVKGAVVKLKMKYILLWTDPGNTPFLYMGEGQNVFIERNCTFVNCYVTGNRSYLGNYTKFDVIAFGGPALSDLRSFPIWRSPHQKYVFASMESSDNYAMCPEVFDDFFNWTWTYKLTSELHWGYITVRDRNNNIVGPNEVLHWKRIDDMDPVSSELKKELRTKSKSAAWFVSNCETRSIRENYVSELQKTLKTYNLDIDIYGHCGPLNCSRKNELVCDEKIKKDYYFYLSFENSFDEDYVTEKLLRPLHYNAIPIVYGEANYTRFMPDGIYLNARDLGPADLASKMYELMHDPEQYIQYFKWKNHYSYHRKRESPETDKYCLVCDLLNNEEMLRRPTTYKDFRSWWNPPNRFWQEDRCFSGQDQSEQFFDQHSMIQREPISLGLDKGSGRSERAWLRPRLKLFNDY